jgi:hypothetical protein
VLVKVSYFPNWTASGADGPYRVSPNLMVVIPTDTEVALSYGWSTPEIAGWGLTAAGLVALLLLARAPSVAVPRPTEPVLAGFAWPAPIQPDPWPSSGSTAAPGGAADRVDPGRRPADPADEPDDPATAADRGLVVDRP